MPKLGLVLEKRGNRVIVVTPAGEFREIAVRGRIPSAGEEIRLPYLWSGWLGLGGRRLKRLSPRQKPLAARVTAAAMAACLAIGLMVLPSSPFNLAERVAEARTVAYVTVDINPSVEMGVDAHRRVLVTRGLNRDGQKILSGLSLSGSDVRTATRRLTAAAIRLGYLRRAGENAVVIAVTPKRAENAQRQISLEEALKEEVAAEVTAAVSAGLGSRRDYPMVQAMMVSGEVRRQAHKMGLSPARYLAFRQAVMAGQQVTVEQFQGRDISAVLPLAERTQTAVGGARTAGHSGQTVRASRGVPHTVSVPRISGPSVKDSNRTKDITKREHFARQGPDQRIGKLVPAPVPGKNVLYIVNGREIGYGPVDPELDAHKVHEKKARVEKTERNDERERDAERKERRKAEREGERSFSAESERGIER